MDMERPQLRKNAIGTTYLEHLTSISFVPMGL